MSLIYLLDNGNGKEIDPYAELNVAKDASIDHIKASYQKLILLHHPDKHANSYANDKGDNNDDGKFRRVFNSWKILSDPVLAHEYNQRLAYVAVQPAYEKVSSSGHYTNVTFT